MYFFANMLAGFKGAAPTPATTSTQPHIDNHVTSADSDNNWEIITPEETAGFYTDRITLFLGPQLDQLYHILLTDIPRSSALLTYLATLDPAHRYLHIADVNTEMVAAYIRILNLYTDALAIEASWLDVIELAITAEVMQDERTENRALCVLRQKGVLAAAPGNSLYLFNDAEYAFARRYRNKTGKGENLIRVLREIGDVELERLGLPKRKKRVNHQGLAMFGSGTPAPFTAKNGNGAGLGYEHFRERDGKKDGSGGGVGGHRKKQHPTAQPCFATNVDVVRKKRPSNFFSYYMKGQQR